MTQLNRNLVTLGTSRACDVCNQTRTVGAHEYARTGVVICTTCGGRKALSKDHVFTLPADATGTPLLAALQVIADL